MSNVRELVPPDQQAMVAQLETLLDDVERGDVVGFAFVSIRRNGEPPLHGYVGPDDKADAFALVYCLEALKFRLMNHQYGCGDNGRRV